MNKSKIVFIYICIVVVISLYGCACASQAELINETVLLEGMVITVKADWATIEISTIGKNKRKYTWDGESVIVDLVPRQERWYGSLGLYHPQVRPPHNGVVHMVVEEGQQHFQTIDDAILWLDEFGDKPIYRDDGLVISSSSTSNDSSRKFIGINVWQIFVGGKTLSNYQEKGATNKSIEFAKEYMSGDKFETHKKINLRIHYIGGHKPTGLPGSQNSRITIKQ